jgi:uncharacterized protein (TIGR02246 family)
MSKITTEFLVAEAAVRQLHARYADAIWRKDYDAFGDCFTEDCEWITSMGGLRGRAGIVDAIKGMMAKSKRILVSLRTPIIELKNDGSVTSRTYLTEQNILNDGTAFTPIGTYYEHIVNQGDRWRMKWRLSQAHYAGPPDMSGTFVDNPQWGPPPAMPSSYTP